MTDDLVDSTVAIHLPIVEEAAVRTVVAKSSSGLCDYHGQYSDKARNCDHYCS